MRGQSNLLSEADMLTPSSTGPRAIGSLLLLPGLFLVMAATSISSLANDGDGQIGVILSMLPHAESRAYTKLKAAAGKTSGERLDMTKSEMWRVPATNLEALRKAAANAGVGITVLDSKSNMTLAPMNGAHAMTPEQLSMMENAMGDKASMGVSMMALPDAKVLEYAMTKGIHDADTANASAELMIPLNGNITVKAIRKSIDKTGDAYWWTGTVADTGEPVSLMWWPSGRLTGQITYKEHIYAVKPMGGTMHGVVEIEPKMLPPEHAPADADVMKKMNMTVDPLVTTGDASMLEQKPSASELDKQKDAPLASERNATLGKAPITAPPRADGALPRTAPAPVEITLLVGYTKAAARHYTDIRKDLIALAVAEANQSFRDSGISHVRLKLVRAYETNYVEKGSHFDHVFGYANKDDGKMEEVFTLRNKYKADVALLVVDNNNGCGLAAGVAPAADRAFAVVHHQCAATSYSLAHEIGHIIGARHDLELDDGKSPYPFGHGFVKGTEWRTMMSYAENCGKCPRLPIWSNPDLMVRGVPAGDEWSNNARAIAEGAARVAAFR